MKKLKPVVLLETFGKKELRPFDDFMRYELKDKSPDIRRFWGAVYSKDKNSLDFSPTKSFSRKTLSDFSKIAEKFLIQTNVEKDVFSRSIHLSRELRKRKIRKYFERQVNLLNDIKRIKYSDNFSDAVNRLKINREEYLLWNSRNDDAELRRITRERTSLSEILMVQNVLSQNYMKRYNGVEVKENRKELVSIRQAVEFVKHNAEFFRNNYPLIWIMYLLNSNVKDGKSVDLLKSVFLYIDGNEESLSPESLQLCYEALFAIIIQRMKSGCYETFRVTYDILSGMDRKELLNRFEFIPPRLMVTFISIALDFGNLALAESIYKSLEKKLDESGQNTLNLCSAIIEFAKGNFLKSKKLLKEDKSKDPVMYVFNKTYLLKVYYETNELRNIYPLTDSIRHYMRRRKEIIEMNTNILVFLNGVNKLSKIKKNGGKGIHKLYPLMSEKRLYFHKHWIAEKFDELNN